MAWYDFLKRPLFETKGLTAPSEGSRFSIGSVYRPFVADDRRFAQYVREGLANPYVSRGINLLSEGCAGLDWRVMRGDDPAENPAFNSLWMKPAQYLDNAAWFRLVITQYQLAGKVFLRKLRGGVRGQERTVRGFQVLHPDHVRVVASDSGEVVAFEYTRDGATPTRIKPEEMVYIHNPDPERPWEGRAPLMAAAASIDLNNEVRHYSYHLLRNGGVPGGILTTDKSLTPNQVGELKNQIDQTLTGEGRGRPLVMHGGLNWTRQSIGPDEAMADVTNIVTAVEIGLVMAVPPTLLGDSRTAIRANKREDRRGLYTEGIIPMADRIADALNQQLLPDFDESLLLDYDKDNIEPLADERHEVWKRITDAEHLTIDEKREATLYRPLGGEVGETILVGSGKATIDKIMADESQEQQEAEAGVSDGKPIGLRPVPASNE